ncbi:hypothetical protein BJ508DRAFT_365105 [Ascobolus immersus RN42]|uniref:Uncharacterized protein n=1 Tax=Ascobolus immersus RN42 TaxID=1160509 RepID=A0A3N4HRD7_ASCIM|nr:hypothetical protein BJ508DRAFT_365105 [Ascobolus immersus RN42]
MTSRFPDEIALRILEYLTAEPSNGKDQTSCLFHSGRKRTWSLTADLRALCLADRETNRVVTPFLYRKIKPTATSVHLLLRTLVSTNQVGQYIEDLDLYGILAEGEDQGHTTSWEFSSLWESTADLQEELEAGRWDLLNRVRARLNIPDLKHPSPTENESRPTTGLSGARMWALMLLYFTPNLTKLSQGSFTAELELIPNIPALLPKLTSLTRAGCCHTLHRHGGLDGTLVAHEMLSHPKVTELHLAHQTLLTPSLFFHPVRKARMLPSSLTSLTLTHITLDAPSLKALLARTPLLTQLTLSLLLPEDCSTARSCYAPPHQFTNILAPLSSSLKHLSLSSEPPNHYLYSRARSVWIQDASHYTFIGSLAAFTALEKLEMDVTWWTLPTPYSPGMLPLGTPASALLPPRLEQLRIIGFWDEENKEVELYDAAYNRDWDSAHVRIPTLPEVETMVKRKREWAKTLLAEKGRTWLRGSGRQGCSWRLPDATRVTRLEAEGVEVPEEAPVPAVQPGGRRVVVRVAGAERWEVWEVAEGDHEDVELVDGLRGRELLVEGGGPLRRGRVVGEDGEVVWYSPDWVI